MTAAIRLDAVVARRGGRVVLHEVTLDLSAPGVVALIGPNGAGKSTLLRVLAGLQPVTGHLDIAGLDLTDAAARARRIAYLPQARVVHWPLPVADVVALGRLPHQGARPRRSPADAAAIEAAMATMDVTALAARPATDLSGGEQARVLVARALAQQPQILLADEPAAGLDPAHQWALAAALEQIAHAGVRVIVATHDLTQAARAATVVMLDRGRLVATGPAADVMTPARLRDVFGIETVRIGDTLVTSGLAASLPSSTSTAPAAH
jgi:iron complex transport system ATP-binding protein